ncbi:MAG: YwaF family protein [Eubacteriales bacterium]|nr:YwaF family protein [Eubacteriales bacterium]
MDITFNNTPAMYGPLHLSILAAIAVLAASVFPVLRKAEEKTLYRMTAAMGLFMIVTEIWKQRFVYVYVYPGITSFWFFPWQLCSMSMYLSAALPFLKGRLREAALVFQASFSLLASVFALLFPGDMMRPQILLFIHSFAYHALMILEAMCAALILSRHDRPSFRPALILYICCALIAEVVNIISHYAAGESGIEANMFNITPYYPSTQPVFHDIAVKIGIIPEIILYLTLIALGSYWIYKAQLRTAAKTAGYTLSGKKDEKSTDKQ